MNILVLGGNGYLGSKVVKRLIELEHSVVCTRREKSSLNRLDEIIQNPSWNRRLMFIPACIEAIDVVLNYNFFDCVINMACNYGRSNVLYDNVIESNIEFPLNVLNRVVESGTTKIITIGTGLPADFNMYSFSKKMFGEFGNFYVAKHNIDFFNMKLEMFYGSDEPRDRFIPSLIYNMKLGKEINVTLGTQHRDIISVNDVVKAILVSLSSELSGYQEISVGTGIAPQIMEIVDFIWKETGQKSVINYGAIPMRQNEPDCIADNTILKSLCEWNPIYWKIGLTQMINELNTTD